MKTVAVVGMGKIGLPLAIQFGQHGYSVLGCDSNPAVVSMLNSGRSHVQEEPELRDVVALAVKEGMLRATTNTTAAVREAEIVVVIVPVVIDAEQQVDFLALDAATQAIGEGLHKGQLIIYETTLPVGTTATRLRHLLEESSHLLAGRDFYLAYSPERVSSGSIFRDLRIYPKIVGGIDEESSSAATAFYRSVLEAEVMTMASSDEAEFVKLIETTYRDVNIALANEFARFADTYGLDVAAAIKAANTQPYSHIHAPGMGVGGHCIPVYPHFLLATDWAARADTRRANKSGPYGYSLDLLRVARATNDGMADYAVWRVEEELGTLEGEAILILGVAYRGDVHETAFTSAWLLQEALHTRGARVYVDDPLFSDEELVALGYTPLPSEQRGEVHAIMLQAAHQAYQDYDLRQFSGCRVFLDGRRALSRERVEALGIRYLAIGDGRVGRGYSGRRADQFYGDTCFCGDEEDQQCV